MYETIKARTFRAYGRRQIDTIPQLQGLNADTRLAMTAVASVLPFRVNNYVVEDLIRWEDVPEDPIFQLTFPQPDMLEPNALSEMIDVIRRKASPEVVRGAAQSIQRDLNPHPAGQLELNVPNLGGQPLRGLQHKYRETVLFFPSQGQTCHSYCTYCFRWPQFVGLDDLKFASSEADTLVSYLRANTDVTSVLFTGGDPLVMKTAVLRRYIEPLLTAKIPHLRSIRIGTKATTYWPYRFLTDGDADDLMRLFEDVQKAGKHITVMAHVTHPRELSTLAAQAAFRRIRQTGAVIRCQAPVVRHVNDSARTWAEMWRQQVQLGAVPYYMFVERDTGPRNYFEVPLDRAHSIFRGAYRRVSGLARTVRGPSMSTTAGKICVDGVANVGGRSVFVLRFLQARDPSWVGIPFFARYDSRATWVDDLRPAFGEREFFFAPELRRLTQRRIREDREGVSGERLELPLALGR